MRCFKMHTPYTESGAQSLTPTVPIISLQDSHGLDARTFQIPGPGPALNFAQSEDVAHQYRDARCIVGLTRQFSNLAPVPKTPMGQIEGGLRRAESLEMHTMSSAELKMRCSPASALSACAGFTST